MSLRLAILGAGDAAAPYLKYLAGREDAVVVGVCDADARAAESVAAGWNARAFPHYDPMLKDCSPDAVLVCVPSRLQKGVLDLAVERGIPFLVEPPGAVDFAAGLRLQQRIRETKLVAAAAYAARSIDLIQEAKEYLAIHKIPLACGWWMTPAADPVQGAAGLLWSDACRLIDLIRYFCGEVEQVAALAAAGEAITATLRLDNGTAASLVVGAYAMAEPRIELELAGEGWYFRFLQHFTVLRLAETEKTTLVRQANKPHAEHLAAFIKAVISKNPADTLCPYADAWQTMRVAQAIEQAAKANAWIKMADVGR